MLVTPLQMKETEMAAFRSGRTAECLMEHAGKGIADTISQFFPQPGTLVIFCGKGHNAGDALVAVRHLGLRGWRILICLATPENDLAPLTRLHLKALPDSCLVESIPDQTTGELVLLDGLLGIGANGSPRSDIALRITEMNELRVNRGGFSIAIDLPSGLDGSSGVVFDPCIQADLTITLGFAKTGLFTDHAASVAGRVALVPLPDLHVEGKIDRAEVLTAGLLRPLLPVRNFDTHKGCYGRIGILAGSRGMLGAARLASSAAVHAGGGLVTLYAMPEAYEILASLCIPEVMVKPISSALELLSGNHDVLALGPGLGRSQDQDLLRIIEESPIPCIVDADALNALSTDLSILNRCAGPRLLTPHPGEMERLDPACGRSRREWAEGFAALYPVTLLLKGARTLIAEHATVTVFNSTGNPGMGSGGMGDVLTGVCSALIGGGHSLRSAVMLGAWLCGRAAEIAIFNGSDSQESLSATSVISHFGAACTSLRNGEF
jgi:NAD(P)H-hydrate epimerase